jgi:DNA-binding transcriptional LysR family regulator
MVNEGEVDFGITSGADLPKTIDYQPLLTADRMLITSKTHPLSKKTKVTLEDIVQFPLIVPTRETNTRSAIERAFQEHGTTFTVAMEVVGREAVKTYVEMNLGVAIINEYYLSSQDRKRLHVKNVSGYFGQTERGIVTRRGKYFSSLAQAFIEIVTHHCKDAKGDSLPDERKKRDARRE